MDDVSSGTPYSVSQPYHIILLVQLQSSYISSCDIVHQKLSHIRKLKGTLPLTGLCTRESCFEARAPKMLPCVLV